MGELTENEATGGSSGLEGLSDGQEGGAGSWGTDPKSRWRHVWTEKTHGHPCQKIQRAARQQSLDHGVWIWEAHDPEPGNRPAEAWLPLPGCHLYQINLSGAILAGTVAQI